MNEALTPTEAELLALVQQSGARADALPLARAVAQAVADRAAARIAELCDAIVAGERSLDEMHLPVFDLAAVHDIANGVPRPAADILRQRSGGS